MISGGFLAVSSVLFIASDSGSVRQHDRIFLPMPHLRDSNHSLISETIANIAALLGLVAEQGSNETSNSGPAGGTAFVHSVLKQTRHLHRP
jgi:hypothetical protein